MTTIINENFNGVRILQREDGKFGLQEIIEGVEQEPAFRWRTLELATKTAQEMSFLNDRNDAYVNSLK